MTLYCGSAKKRIEEQHRHELIETILGGVCIAIWGYVLCVCMFVM